VEISSVFVTELESGATGQLVGVNAIWRAMLSDQHRYENGAVLVIGFENREEAKSKTILTNHNLTVTAYHIDVDQLDLIVAAVQSDLIDLEGQVQGRFIKKVRMTLRTSPEYDNIKNMWAVSMEFVTNEGEGS
jgi:hypothetical protein